MPSADVLEQLRNSRAGCYYVCRRLLRNDKAAEAVCCDVYKKVLSNPEKLPIDTDINFWMKNVAAVACATYLRRNDAGFFFKNPTASDVGKKEVVSGVSLNMSATAEYVENCIDRMSSPVAFATVCYYYNGMTVPQIAAVLAVPVLRVKELMRIAAAEIGILVKEFNNKQVTTTKIDLQALLDIRATACVPPHIEIGGAEEQTGAASAPQKSAVSFKKIVLLILIPLLVCGSVLAVVYNKLNPINNGAESKKVSSSESAYASSTESSVPQEVVSEIESQIEKEESVPEKPAKPAVKTPPQPTFLITKETFYDEGGERVREAVYNYSNGRLSSSKTATLMFTEELYYKWNKGGTKRTITDADGEVVEIAKFDEYGNHTSLTYGDETVKYTWKYTLNKEGYVARATYKAKTSGRYDYTYTPEGRIATETLTVGKDKYTTAYTYDAFGMVKSKVQTNFDGNITETFYAYDYSALTFTATNSDGTTIQGKIAANTALSNS